MHKIYAFIFYQILTFFQYCTTPSQGLHADGLRLKATVQKVYRKGKDKNDSVKKECTRRIKRRLKTDFVELEHLMVM